MELPTAVQRRLAVLTDPLLVRWDECGLLTPEHPRLERWRMHLDRAAARVAEARTTLPLEQVDLLRGLPPSSDRAFKALGAVGEALSFLARRYLLVEGGYPVVRHERLLEYQEVRLSVVAEQVACFKVAEELHAEGGSATSHALFDWPPGLRLQRPHLAHVLDREIVDGHVHLGGVLGTLDLWREVLDPRVRQRRLATLSESAEKIDGPLLEPEVARRLEDARTLRDLMSMELSVRGTLSCAGTERLVQKAVEQLVIQCQLERIFSPPPGAPPGEVAIAHAMARTDPVPYTLSPWAEEVDGSEPADANRPLVSERALLVHAFTALIGAHRPAPHWFAPVLIAYLTCQNAFHRAVTQHLRRVGLGSFLGWYDSPARWLRGDSARARRRLILHRATRGFTVRVEGRVTPQPEVIRRWIDALPTCTGGARLGHDFGLVVHFIKEPDDRCARAPHPDAGGGAFVVRHERLRRKLRHQACDLEMLRNRFADAAEAVVGIDAARLETDAGAEVFAPAFRYLRRRFPGGPPNGSLMGDSRKKPRPLRATFHAGESFHHPLTGLRSVDEAVTFLDLRPGERIGHGMILGIDPSRWLMRSGTDALLTREERLDNLVWAAHKLRSSAGIGQQPSSRIFDLIASEFESLYRQPVPGGRSLVDLLAWSWRLRFMDPDELFGVLEGFGFVEGAPSRRLLDRTAAADCARMSGTVRSILGVDLSKTDARDFTRYPQVAEPTLTATRLAWRLSTVDLELLLGGDVPLASVQYLWRYQYDTEVYQRGREPVHWSSDCPDLEGIFPTLRTQVLDQISSRNLTVEACPNSNARIGAFGGLEKHPIFELDTRHLKKHPTSRVVRVVVCTDDPGIFATNLANEYALLACAAEQSGEDPEDVLRWLDHLRRRSLESTFLQPRPAGTTDSHRTGRESTFLSDPESSKLGCGSKSLFPI